MFPREWKIYTGEELSTLITKGESPSWQGFHYEDEGVLFVTSENVREGFFDNLKPKFISERFHAKLRRSQLAKNDILINLVGASIGRSCVFPLENLQANINQAVCLLRLKKTINPLWVSYLLQEPKNLRRLLDSQGDSARANLSLADIRNFKFVVPPDKELNEIIQILGTWDRAIAKTKSLLVSKQVQKRALVQKLLTGKQRFPQFAQRPWEEVKLSTVFDRVTRKNDEENTNVVTISAQRGFIKQTDFFNKSIASEILDNYFLVERGEFCYNKSYSNGYPWGATKRLKDFDKAVVTTLYICFKIKDETKYSGDFFEEFFEANLLDKGLTRTAHEGGRAHGLLNVTPSDFFTLKIAIPPLNEQIAIAHVLQMANQEIHLLKKQLNALKSQKRGLMQQLLTGKVRVRVGDS